MAEIDKREQILSAALAAKYAAIDGLLGDSPHADELYDEHEKARPEVRAIEEAIDAMVAEELSKAGAPQPHLLARLVLDAAWGIKRKARDTADVGPGIQLLVERLVGPEVVSTAPETLPVSPSPK